MHIPGIQLNEEITIDRLYSVHYFEFSSTYAFPGESHDFWEMVYVDKGKITVVADDRQLQLESGSFFFHHPNQWHTLLACDGVAANIAIVSFSSGSPAMDGFGELSLSATPAEKQLIANIIAESTLAFSSPLDDPYNNHLSPRTNAVPGSQQLIRLYLSELLIFLLRRISGLQSKPAPVLPEAGLFGDIVAYMQRSISQKLTLTELARTFGISVSSLKALFQKQTGTGVIAYFIRMKIDRAKELLRGRSYNVTQVAAFLGYESIYSFSAQFKKVTGMSPTEYLLSVKSREGPRKA